MRDDTAPIDKLYVTNRAALDAKYAPAAASAILERLDALVAADADRGLLSAVAFLDQPEQRLAAVSRPDDEVATKIAIDEWVSLLAPQYLVIVGGLDIVCMQSLANPLPQGDDDPLVPSDLPYACQGPPTGSITRYLGPDRVVGRLPDATGGSDPSSFLALLDAAAAPVSVSPPMADSTFAVCAQKWDRAGAAMLSIAGLSGTTLHTSPPEGPVWPPGILEVPWHLISLHGASLRPQFWGEPPNVPKPVAHQADLVTGRLARGTVCVTGCCYGAQLYPLSLTSGQHGIVTSYIESGCAAYIGSTTIAYGADDQPYGCDEFCGYVMAALRRGSSTGRALLEARQTFVRNNPILGPEQQKTLAQFVLYGDPSYHPWTESEASPTHRRAERGEIRALLQQDAIQGLMGCQPAIPRSALGPRGSQSAPLGSLVSDRVVASLSEAGFEGEATEVYSVSPLASGVLQSRSFIDARMGLDVELASLVEPARIHSMAVALRHVDGGDEPTIEGVRVVESLDDTIEVIHFSSR